MKISEFQLSRGRRRFIVGDFESLRIRSAFFLPQKSFSMPQIREPPSHHLKTASMKFLSTLLAGLLLSPFAEMRAAEPYNVLVLMCDEHNPHIMGCAGDPLVKTPTFDSLRRQRRALHGRLLPESHLRALACFAGQRENALPHEDIWEHGKSKLLEYYDAGGCLHQGGLSDGVVWENPLGRSAIPEKRRCQCGTGKRPRRRRMKT